MNRVKALREHLGLNQAKFAENLGVTGAWISKLEKTDRDLNAKLARLICLTYGVNAHWLETGEGAMFDADPAATGQLAEAMEIFKSLRPAFQEFALEQMRRLVDLQKKTGPA